MIIKNNVAFLKRSCRLQPVLKVGWRDFSEPKALTDVGGVGISKTYTSYSFSSAQSSKKRRDFESGKLTALAEKEDLFFRP